MSSQNPASTVALYDALTHHFNCTMIVTVAVVRVMEMARNQVIHVVSMRNRSMAALGPMNVSRVVHCAIVVWRAVGRVAARHLQNVFVDVIPVWMMNVSIVEIVDVVRMSNRGMPAAFAVYVRMSAVDTMRIVAHWVVHRYFL